MYGARRVLATGVLVLIVGAVPAACMFAPVDYSREGPGDEPTVLSSAPGEDDLAAHLGPASAWSNFMRWRSCASYAVLGRIRSTKWEKR